MSFTTTYPHFPAQLSPVLTLIVQFIIVLEAIDMAVHACFPKILPCKTHRVPGWNDRAKSLRQKAIFWDRIVAVLLEIKKSTKSH